MVKTDLCLTLDLHTWGTRGTGRSAGKVNDEDPERSR